MNSLYKKFKEKFIDIIETKNDRAMFALQGQKVIHVEKVDNDDNWIITLSDGDVIYFHRTSRPYT